MPLKKEKALLIVNPKAGKQSAKAHIFEIINELSAKYTLTVHITEGPGDAVETAKEAGDFDAVICCGGDGTLSQTVQGVMQLEKKPVIGYLPCGTANDVASTLRLPKNFKEGARQILGAEPQPHDIGLFNGKPFVYVASFGTFSKTSYETPQDVKNVFGEFAYLFTGISELGNICGEDVTVIHDGVEDKFENVTLLSVNNTASIGGIVKLPKEQYQLDDGRFEMLIVKKPKNLSELQNTFFSVTKGEFDGKNAVLLHFRSAEIRIAHAVDWSIDGEAGGSADTVSIGVVPKSIEILHQ